MAALLLLYTEKLTLESRGAWEHNTASLGGALLGLRQVMFASLNGAQ